MNRWDELQLAAFEGKIGRRDFMRRAAALGITTTLASGILSSAGFAAEPKKGGTFRLGMEGGSPSDRSIRAPMLTRSRSAPSLAICNGLVEFDSDGNPTGELFESWEVKPGAKEWVFNVRKDITFSNGKTLDADDVHLLDRDLHRGEDQVAGARASWSRSPRSRRVAKPGRDHAHRRQRRLPGDPRRLPPHRRAEGLHRLGSSDRHRRL